MADFARAQQNARYLVRGGRVIRHHALEAARGQCRKRAAGVGMAQHAFRREADQRLAPLAQSLTAQQVEVLRGRRRLADLHVIACAQLQIAFYAGAGVLRPLALIAVRQQQDEAAEQTPLFLAGADELVNDDLRPVGEVAKLCFPKGQRLREVTAEAILVPEDCGLAQLRVVDFDACLRGRQMIKRHVFALVLNVYQAAMAMIEGAAAAVLSAHAHRHSLRDQAGEGQGLGHAVIQRAPATGHLLPLLEQRRHLGMNVETLRVLAEPLAQMR